MMWYCVGSSLVAGVLEQNEETPTSECWDVHVSSSSSLLSLSETSDSIVLSNDKRLQSTVISLNTPLSQLRLEVVVIGLEDVSWTCSYKVKYIHDN